jgi:ankyrin repeat protein
VKLTEFLASLSDVDGWFEVESIGVMIRGTTGDTPLHAALWRNDDEAARELVEAGADVNASGEEGYTPLHVAVAQANAAMARFLSNRGASWTTASSIGPSPLENARSSESVAIRALAGEVRLE